MKTAIDVAVGLRRADFPILNRQVRGRPLVYLDNAATTQKPTAVIEAVDKYYRLANANVHRGLHQLSEEATNAFEAARTTVQQFINAPSRDEIIFTRGTTESINLVAQAFGRPTLKVGDEVLISAMEHHSNIVPWQIVAEQTGAIVKVIPIDDRGQLDMAAYEKLLNDRTSIVAVTHVSNALGTVNPIDRITALAHEHDAVTVIDGAQAVPHAHVDVQQLDCDFYAFSGHKLFAPTGIGALYGKMTLLEAMPPYQGGGEMIRSVTFEKTTYKKPPGRFEAGTPHIAGAIGLGAAIDYVQAIGLDTIAAHEQALLAYGTEQLTAIEGLKMIGTADHKAGVLSFVLDDVHPHDIATVLDTYGLAVRAGHHCAQPVMDRFDIPATTRASLAFYNQRSDIDALVDALRATLEMFR